MLELFTSQGCSSCPPADRLFAKLASDPQFIVLSLPVDYWDRLGWKDTFAKHAFTERQRAYASVRGDGQVYTPQAVVNGSEHANGANRRAIDASAETTSDLSVPVIAERMGDDIIVSVGGKSAGGAANATIEVLPYLGSREVAIGRGENAREKLTYTNIVRDIVPIGRWEGKRHAAVDPAEGLCAIRRCRRAAAGGHAGAARRHSGRGASAARRQDLSGATVFRLACASLFRLEHVRRQPAG